MDCLGSQVTTPRTFTNPYSQEEGGLIFQHRPAYAESQRKSLQRASVIWNQKGHVEEASEVYMILYHVLQQCFFSEPSSDEDSAHLDRNYRKSGAFIPGLPSWRHEQGDMPSLGNVWRLLVGNASAIEYDETFGKQASHNSGTNGDHIK